MRARKDFRPSEAIRTRKQALEQRGRAATFMIGSPTRFESVELWEEHLNELRSMPDCGLKQGRSSTPNKLSSRRNEFP